MADSVIPQEKEAYAYSKAQTDALIAQSTATGGAGYFKSPDGTLIQWGAVTIPANTYTATINFEIPFINRTELSIQVTPLQLNESWNINYSSTTVSATSIGRTPNTAASTYYWMAMGRWK